MAQMARDTLTTCLWFDTQAEEAMRFYASILPNSSFGDVAYYVEDSEYSPARAGDVLVATATLMGQPFVGLNGGPIFPHSEAASWMIPCKDQAEVDKYWDALQAGGGSPSQCGWLKDRFGVSWQVVPTMLIDIQMSGDTAKIARVTKAFMQMQKFDVAELERAAAG